ncbi:MAG TPA: nucleotidyltransferase domain-containing protein [Candidatus Xenobia bacterium]|jgi:hypothetical protein
MQELDYQQLSTLLTRGPVPVFATVSGAHLYGFPSPNSDIDLRGAFVLPLRVVLGLKLPRETLTVTSYPGDFELDWVAHDIHKFARMMSSRNGYVLEQLYSPLVVHGGEWLDRLRHVGQGFMISHLYYHYRGFLLNQRKLLSRSEPTVKALLYAYRVAFTGMYVLRSGRIESSLPRLMELFEHPELGELLARKQLGDEHGALRPGELEAHEPRLEKLQSDLEEVWKASPLPKTATPAALDALNDYVVDIRLALGA